MSALPKNWVITIAEQYAIGASDEEVCASLKISMTRFKSYYSADPNFRQAVDDGRGVAKAWWLAEGRKNLHNKQFNYTGWFQNMKNRYGWADKSEVTDPSARPIEQQSDEDLQKNVEKLLAKLGGNA